jgi:hypothetical protein
MPDIKQTITASIINDINAYFDDATLVQAGIKAGQEAVEQIIKRTQSGKDVDNRNFGNYNSDKNGKPYNKKRAYKYAAKKFGTTKYASTKTKDKLQLTGNLFSAISYKLKKITRTNSNIKFTIELYIKGRRENLKAEGLMSTTGVARNGSRYSKKSWKFFGLSNNSTQLGKESSAIKRAIVKVLGTRLRTTVKEAA